MDKSKRNRYAGKHKSYDEKGMSDEAIRKKKEYDSEYQKTPSRVAYRSKLNKKNREAGTYGNSDGLDISHGKDGKTTMESMSKNRARNGSNGKSTKK